MRNINRDNIREKLEDMLSYLLRIRDFRKYDGKTIRNNVYMDLRGRKSGE